MAHPNERGARRRWAPGVLLTVAATGALLWLGTSDGEQPLEAPATVGTAAQPRDDSTSDVPVSAAAEDAPATSERSAVPPLPPAEPVADFETLLEQMVDAAMALREAVKDRDAVDPEVVQAIQEEAAATWTELHRQVLNPGEKALYVLCEEPSDRPEPRAVLRRRVCLQLLFDGLGRRLRRFESTGERGQLDALVSAVLSAIPKDAETATTLGAQLADRPFLGLSHEEQVLDLVTMSTEHDYLVEVSTDLLRTLWTNLERAGARTSGELAGLALLFKDDANPSRRLAALQHLLAARDGRYRDVAVEDVLRRKDLDGARELGMAAALSLEPAAALAALERLTPLAGQNLMGAFMTLAEREPSVLHAVYDRQLAANSDAAFRAELVTGAGFRGTPEAIEMARTAFTYDPDTGVRARAMLVLTAKAAAALGEQTLMAALDDDAFHNTAGVGQISAALENLARHGDANAVDRVGRRLLARSELTEADRARVVATLERVLPK